MLFVPFALPPLIPSPFSKLTRLTLELLPLTGDLFRADLNKCLNLTKMERRVFDASFKRMAINLSYARGSVKEVADELGIDPGRLSKWRQQESSPVRSSEGLNDDQKEIKQLQKELKEAQLERGILKNAVSIFSRGDGRYTDS